MIRVQYSMCRVVVSYHFSSSSSLFSFLVVFVVDFSAHFLFLVGVILLYLIDTKNNF